MTVPAHMRPRVYVTCENLGALYRDNKVPYEVARFIQDPCSTILMDSLAEDRADQSRAAKADRAKRQAARAELLALAHRARHTAPVAA